MDEELYNNFKAVLRYLHRHDILYCEATDRQVRTALNAVRKK